MPDRSRIARALLVLSIVLVAAGALHARPGMADSSNSGSVAAPPLNSETVGNLSYPNDFSASGIAPLANGSYSEPGAPGSAGQVTVQLRRAAFGEIGGAAAAAVVLATDTGGSGTFYELQLVIRADDGVAQSVAQRLLGDRIRLQGLAFVGERIRVDFTGFAPADGICCPTLNLVQEFRFHAGQLELVRANEAPALLDVPAGLSLVGWYGGPTSSRAILASAPHLESVWAFDSANQTWLSDVRVLPPRLRDEFAVGLGSGLFVRARAATQIRVPLIHAPAACPLNPGTPHPVQPAIVVERPGAGELLSGAVPVAGWARVFEANVRIRILAADGSILADTHTTALFGAPESGPFATEIPVSVAAQTDACVQIFEESALDGSETNVVQIGVTLAP